MCIVDLIIFLGIYVGTILPFLLLSEDNGYWKELAILIKELAKAILAEEFLTLTVDMEDDICTSLST